MINTILELESQTVENFIDRESYEAILDIYYSAWKKAKEYYGDEVVITEWFFKEADEKTPVPNYIVVRTRDFSNVEIHEHQKFYSTEFTKYLKPEVDKLIKLIIPLLNKKFLENNLPGKLCNFALLCLQGGLNIHCDGQDIDTKLKKSPRPSTFPYYSKTEYVPKIYKNYSHQGLITLKNGHEKNGTIIFDQWFPYSVYLIQDKEDTNVKKTNIKFFKNDPKERFDETIKEYTYKPMPETQYQELQSIIQNEDALSREACHGLTVDKILRFGKSGTLNVWADKKFHMPIPYANNFEPIERITLQYEAIC